MLPHHLGALLTLQGPFVSHRKLLTQWNSPPFQHVIFSLLGAGVLLTVSCLCCSIQVTNIVAFRFAHHAHITPGYEDLPEQ